MAGSKSRMFLALAASACITLAGAIPAWANHADDGDPTHAEANPTTFAIGQTTTISGNDCFGHKTDGGTEAVRYSVTRPGNQDAGGGHFAVDASGSWSAQLLKAFWIVPGEHRIDLWCTSNGVDVTYFKYDSVFVTVLAAGDTTTTAAPTTVAPTTAAPTTVPPTDGGQGTTAPAPTDPPAVGSGEGELPRTGSSTLPLTLLGVGLVFVGLASSLGHRRAALRHPNR